MTLEHDTTRILAQAQIDPVWVSYFTNIFDCIAEFANLPEYIISISCVKMFQ